MIHQNLHGDCPKCDEIFERYAGFHADLRMWFDAVRRTHFDAHISCAGRGKVDQQAFFHRGASNAQWTQSAHNWNAAIDVWFLDPVKINHYSLDREKFAAMFASNPLTTELNWYGAPMSRFPELPHIEMRNWRDMAQRGDLALVEPI